MSSRSESAIIKTFSNFNQLIDFINSLGITYQPVNNAISLGALLNLRTSSLAVENKFRALCNIYDKAIETQQAEHQKLVQLIDRVEEAFRHSGASERAIVTFISVTRNIKSDAGHKAKASTQGWKAEVRNRSISQQIYTQRAEYFEALLQVLKMETKYNPADEELSLASLQKRLEALQFAAISFGLLQTSLKRAHFHRSESFYHPDKGLIYIVSVAKNYIKNLGYVDYLIEKEEIPETKTTNTSNETEDQEPETNNPPAGSDYPSMLLKRDSELPSARKFQALSTHALLAAPSWTTHRIEP
jgi:hypothetical protein